MCYYNICLFLLLYNDLDCFNVGVCGGSSCSIQLPHSTTTVYNVHVTHNHLKNGNHTLLVVEAPGTAQSVPIKGGVSRFPLHA